LQEPAVQRRIVSDLAELDDVAVVVNPFTNLGLQDRQRHHRHRDGSSLSSPPPRTPQWRGLTLLQELQHAGVNVVCASDNVRDYWYPYGDYDLLAVWKQCQEMAHLDTAPSAGCWAHLVTQSAARAMKVSDYDVDDGAYDKNNRRKSRDWIIFPKARRFSELFARPQTGPDERWIVRNGVRQTYKLPDFSALDDLMI
jgi:cytosine/creatinine deaminase